MFRDTKAFSGFAVPDIAAAEPSTDTVDVSEENDMLTLHSRAANVSSTRS